MTKTEKENQVKALQNLGLTDEEIAEVLESDRKIDKGEKLFELSKELNAGSRKARQAGNTAGYTQTAKREKPINNDKRFLIDTIVWALTTNEPHNGDNVRTNKVEIINPERELSFEYKGVKYKVVLSCPRK